MPNLPSNGAEATKAGDRARSSSIVAVVLLLTGCYWHVNATPLTTYIQRPPTCADAVTVYERAEDVQRPYTPLAELTVWAPGDMAATPQSQQLAQREKAATLGANGLVLRHPRDRLQTSDAKSLAIFVSADSATAKQLCVRASTQH